MGSKLSVRHLLRFVPTALILSGLLLNFASPSRALAGEMAAYDPLAVPAGFTADPHDLTAHDGVRGRDIPLRVYLPTQPQPAAVVMFSHGLGGSRGTDAFLGQHWAARGYAAIFVQHPGSDDAVWLDAPVAQRMAAMQRAASPQNLKLRAGDISAVLDQLKIWNETLGHLLHGRLDLGRVGMSGHSFGAVTTQAVSGQSFRFANLLPTETRIKAACMFSPSSPQRGMTADQAFGAVKISWLLMTGTRDSSPIGNIDVASRLAVYPALPPGGKYQVVLDGAQHSDFGDGEAAGREAANARDPRYRRAMLALTTAFWDAYLKNDRTAQTWLDGAGPRTVLQPADQWNHK